MTMYISGALSFVKETPGEVFTGKECERNGKQFP